MIDRTVVTHPPRFPYRSLQASSYDRRSVTPNDPAGWFANSDNNQVIRYETNQGRTEAVMMEYSGPGVITSIWTPFFYFDFNDRVGTDIRIYIDGETTPSLTTKLIDLVRGNGPVPVPFGQPTARAGCLYLPIPFRNSIKITQDGAAFYYRINYRAYETGTSVESFVPSFLTSQQSLIQQTGAELTQPTAFAGGTSITLGSFTPAANLSLTAPQPPPTPQPPAFSAWIGTFPALSESDHTHPADPDGDEFSNLVEFTLKGDPTDPANHGLTAIATPDLTGPTGREMTLTLAVRSGAVFSGSPSPAATIESVRYQIEGSLDLTTFGAAVIEAPIPLASADTGLPDLNGSGWKYHTFILTGSMGLPDKGILRVKLDQP